MVIYFEAWNRQYESSLEEKFGKHSLDKGIFGLFIEILVYTIRESHYLLPPTS